MSYRTRTRLSATAVIAAGLGLVLMGGWLWAFLLAVTIIMLAANVTLARRS